MAGSSFLSRAWICSLLAGVGAIVLVGNDKSATAQNVIVLDETLGAAERSQVGTVTINGIPASIIQGGATRGINLFHSFLNFNVAAGQGAYFIKPNNQIQNILARVTGSNRSDISGTLGTGTLPGVTERVNLFLINPNGIVFGSNASLDVGGSFYATTANAVQLGSAGLFSASQPTSSNLLSVNPSAFLFNAIANQNLPEIVVRSRATQTVLGTTTDGLRVPDGQQLLLLGGNVNVDGGVMVALGGRVEIGAVTGLGTVGLNANGSLQVPDSVQQADVSINAARVTVDLDGGGDIGIIARNISILSGSVLRAGIRSSFGAMGNQAGDVTLNARGEIRIGQSSVVQSIVRANAIGNAGNVKITTNSLAITNGAQLSSSTLGTGDAGNVVITATGNVSFDGTSADRRVLSGAVSTAQLGSSGKGGDVRIMTNSLSLTNGAQLNSSTFSTGDAGNVVITATGNVSFDGTSADGRVLSGVASRAQRGSSGKGGDVHIMTNSLSVTNGALLASSTSGRGDAGNVVITATGDVSFNGISGAVSSAEPSSSGKGGDVRITTNSLSLTNGSRLVSSTTGTGDAGNVVITATGNVSFDGTSADGRVITAAVSSAEPSSSGKGGDVRITTNSLSLTNGSRLVSNTSGAGDAGNVVITATGNVSFDGTSVDGRFPSGVASNVQPGSSGKGGDVRITTNSLSLTNGAQLNSSTFSTGDAGNVVITATGNVSFDGTSVDGRFSSIAASSAEPGSSGKGGNVSISANYLSLTNEAQLVSSTSGTGDAGDVVVLAQRDVQFNGGTIETRSLGSSGGNIQVSAKRIRLLNNSDLRTFVESGGGKGGDITLTADSIVALNDSDILTFSSGGIGGNITFNTPAFFGQNYRPGSPPPFGGNNRVDINASGIISGIIIIPDTTFVQNSLAQLAQNLIDPNVLLANSCIVRNREQNGSFFVTGSGGLPVRPGDPPPASFPTGEVRSLPNTQNQSNRPWKPGDAIVEPQGIYRLPNGKLVMSRECQTQ